MQAQGMKIINNMQIETSSGTVYWQEDEPTNPKDGDTWFKVINGKATNGYNRENGQWIEVAFASQIIAEELVGKIITAAEINGGEISGARFINQYANVTSGTNQVTDGVFQIESGILQAGASYYLTDSAGTKLYKFATTEADIHQGAVHLIQKLYDDKGVQTSQSSANISGGLISLSLSDASGNYTGVLDAKALTNTPWVTLSLGSAFETKESNPCQYKITYNLDGSKTVSFRGQFGLKSGSMPAGEFYPFQTGTGSGYPGNTGGVSSMPASIIPEKTVFSYAATNTPYGGRLAVSSGGHLIFTSNNNAAYCSISGMSYTIN